MEELRGSGFGGGGRLGNDGGPEVEGVLEEVDLGFGVGLDGALDDGEEGDVEGAGVSFHGVGEAREDGEDGLFHEVLFAGLLPEGWEERDDAVGVGGDLEGVSRFSID